MTTFGDTTQNGVIQVGVDAVIVRAATLPVDGQVTSMSSWNGTRLFTFVMAVYADSGGLPGALKGSTCTGTTTGLGFQALACVSPIFLPAGNYWLAVLYGGSGLVDVGVDTPDGPVGSFHYVNSSYPTLPDPYGTPASNDVQRMSLFATYTPGVTLQGNVFGPAQLAGRTGY